MCIVSSSTIAIESSAIQDVSHCSKLRGDLGDMIGRPRKEYLLNTCFILLMWFLARAKAKPVRSFMVSTVFNSFDFLG